MTTLEALVDQLKEQTAWQRTPEELEYEDYLRIVIRGIKTLFIDTGRAEEFSSDMFRDYEFNYHLAIDEEKYVLLVSQIEFFKKVQSDVNNIVGYTTNALSVTNADKPYAHLQDTIQNLENERRIVFYKMRRYSMPSE